MGYSLVARWGPRARRGRSSQRTGSRLAEGGRRSSAWCGMRGIVTLATALALARGVPPTAGLVLLWRVQRSCLVTLVVQGFTLTPLLNAASGSRRTAPSRTKVTPCPARGLRERRSRPWTARQGRAEGDLLALLRRKLEGPGSSRRTAERGAEQGMTGLEPEGQRARGERRHRGVQRGHAKGLRGPSDFTLFELRRSGVIGDDAFPPRGGRSSTGAEVNAEDDGARGLMAPQ